MQENFGFMNPSQDKKDCYPSAHAFGLHMLGLPISRSAIDMAIGRHQGQPANFENRIRCTLFLVTMGLDVTYISPDDKRPMLELAKLPVEDAYREIMHAPTTWPSYTINMFRKDRSTWQKYDTNYTAAISTGQIVMHDGIMTPERATSYLRYRSPYDSMKPGAYMVAGVRLGEHVVAITEHPRYRDSYVLYDTGHGVISFCEPYGIKDIFRNLDVMQDYETAVVRLRGATEPSRERDPPPIYEY